MSALIRMRLLTFSKRLENKVSCIDMKKILTTYEASIKYGVTTGYIRQIMASQKVIGNSAQISESRFIYLIDSKSLEEFMKNRPKPGRPSKKN